MTFAEYLKKCRAGDNTRGDLVADLRHDKRLPAIAHWHQLQGYLLARRAAPNVVLAARQLWRGYLRAQRTAYWKAKLGA